MTKLTWVMLIFCCAGFCSVSRAQSNISDAKAVASRAKTTIDLQSPCGSLLTTLWDLEHKFENTYLSETPATDARALFAKAKKLEDDLLTCEVKTSENDVPLHDALMAEASNLRYIENTAVMNGGMGGFPIPSFHKDLTSLAPACREVLTSKLPEKIEALTKEYQETSRIKEDLDPLYENSPALTNCSMQAMDAGYLRSAIRLLNDASVLNGFMIGQLLDENKTLRHANSKLVILLNSMPSHTITVPVESQHCTATLQDLPWGKSIDWDCY